MNTIHIGSGPESLTLRIHGRTKPKAQDYWDGNWLHCTAEASVSSSRSAIDWQLRNQDLARFMHSLERLSRRSGAALLETVDGWLDVLISRDELGHIEARCHLVDNDEGENTLEFRLSLDQTALSVLMAQLREVLECYPVVGREGA